MTILLLKGYNNYFNRIIKKETDITTYKTASTSYLEYPNVNFDPRDGIATSLVVGSEGQLDNGDILKFDDLGNPDYLIVHDNTTIKSRWFIIESLKIRSGQYKLTLKRDVLVDFFNDIKDSPCYIEKATITDVLNPLLYNKEGLQVNQIKKAEHLLKDTSKVAWVVGYIASNLNSDFISGNFGTIPLNNSGVASGSFVLPGNTYQTFTLTNVTGDVIYATGNSGDNKFNYTWNISTRTFTYSINLPEQANQSPVLRYTAAAPTTVASDKYSVNLAGDNTRTHLEDAPYDMFCIPFGEILLNGANVTTTKEVALEIAFEFAKDLGSNLYDIQLLPYCPRPDMIANGKIFEVLGSLDIDYSYIYQGSTIKSILLWCNKSTFSDYAMPDEDIKIERQIDEHTYGKQETFIGTLSRPLLAPEYVQISITNDSLKDLVDIEVTGVEAHHSETGYNVATTAITDKVYNPMTGYLSFRVYDGGDERFTSGSLSNASIKVSYDYQKYMHPEYLDRKVSNECDVYRLTSPNYNGQFEWSLAKGNGTANIFDIDCTYKPFQPYIHVQPRFTNLYGSDFDDCRGLICGGDFSYQLLIMLGLNIKFKIRLIKKCLIDKFNIWISNGN
jgi:hypothetical protein